MSVYTTTSGVSAISPDQIEQLVVRPVAANSIAYQVATTLSTNATETRFPVVSADPTAAWVAEGAEISATDPSLTEIVVTPSKLAGLTILSSESAADTNPAAGDLVGAGLTRDIALKLDAAFFGSVASPAPSGLGALSGVTVVTGGTGWASLDAFAEAVANAEALGLSLGAFVMNPADALLLAKLKDQSGSLRPLLSPDPTNPTRKLIQGVPLFVSSAVTAKTAWGIPKTRAIIVRRNDVDLQVDKSVYFTSDRVAIRATMRVGFGFTQPAAIQKITVL